MATVSTMLTKPLLNLQRTFVPASQGEPSDRGARRATWGLRRVSWADLLLSPCCVVLGEAGSGKTSEFRAKAEELATAGKYAFVLPVEAAAKKGIAKSLDLTQSRKLKAWLESSDPAHFFLDSVDESKLKGHSLGDALTAFAHELEAGLGRAHVLISSRASDWRSSDEEDVARLWPHLISSAKGDETRARILELAPLADPQVTALAKHYGLDEIDRFLEEVNSANAWSFLERPLDVEWLVAYWSDKRRLGTLRELVDFNIDEKLKERQGRPSRISASRAREGARKLALVAQLTSAGAFRLPGETPDPAAEAAIDPAAVLKQWTGPEIEDLLTRALFDEATYGRARIHHRSVQEFLAAEALCLMLDDGLPREDLETLLFRVSMGRTCVPANFAAVVAWLSLKDHEIRAKALRVIPEHLIDQGDPSGLSADDRKEALLAYVELYGDRDRVFHYFDTAGLKRFTSAELAATVRELLTDSTTRPHVKQLLLQLVRHGKLALLADVALDIALSPGAETKLRVAAIMATAEAGSAAQAARLIGLHGTAAVRDSEVLARCIEVLFPNHMSVEELAKWLLDAPRLGKRSATELQLVVSDELPKRLSAEARRFLLRFLGEEMVGTAPGADDEPVVKGERLWLGDLLGEVLKESVGDPGVDPIVLDRAFDAVAACENRYDYHANNRLSDIVREDASVRRRFFWRRARMSKGKGARFPRYYWELKLRSWFHLGTGDAGWLSEDVRTLPNVLERLLAFNTLLQFLPRTTENDAMLDELARSSDDAHHTGVLAKHLVRFRRFEMPERHNPYRMETLARERRKENERRDSLANLRAILPELRTGEKWYALWHLFQVVPAGGYRSDYETVHCEAIAERYDAEVAAAAREGFKRFWREAELEPIEGRKKANDTSAGCILGLAGIGLDVEDGLVVADLPDAKLRRALTFAPWELNRFPPWVECCAERHPGIVRDIFSAALRRDYAQAPDSEGWRPLLLDKVTSAAPVIRLACAPLLLDLLHHEDPPRVDVLRWVFSALQVPGGPEFADTALIRARLEDADPVRFSLWWVKWLSLAPDEAVVHLADVVLSSDDADELLVHLCDRMWKVYDERTRSGLAALRRSVDALAGLIPIVQAHVRPEDDLHHDGGYSPVPRDHAQQLRDSLISWLASINGAATVRALEQLAARTGAGEAERDWLAHLAGLKAAEAVSAPRSVADAVAFAETLILQPRTDHDLFEIGRNRLRDLQHDLTHGDFSKREMYNPEEWILERPLQIYVAGELEAHSRKQYTVVRESEVADKNEPDIRLWNASCGGPVSIEVKMAERWTVRELEDAITTQLVAKYMRAMNSNYGILVLCSSGKAKVWHQGARRLDFSALMEHLTAYAKEVLLRTPAIVDIAIVGMDFH
ncbi:MAG TPA: hypothetical protein VJV79_02355 [Polyangiaceae bacterium]|nr:hypothetical protein [Polyangiaceae bacterium]